MSLICESASAAPVANRNAIIAEIEHDGAKVTVDKLWNSGGWETVIDHISSGDQGWIVLAPRLASGTDAGASEDLGVALAAALPKNPVAVLKAIDPLNGPVLGASRVCSIPFIGEDQSGASLARYKRQALRALRAVNDPALARKKAACATVLRKS